MATKKRKVSKSTGKTKNVPVTESVPQQPQKTQATPDAPLSPDTEKILAALGYPIWIIAVILLIIAKPENKFGKFHAYQGLFFGIAWWIIVAVISAFAGIPFIGWLFSVISGLVGLGFFIVSILYAVKAYNGKTFKVPVVYGLVPASSRM